MKIKDLLNKRKEEKIKVKSGDLENAKVNHKEIWKRFFYTCKVANIPYWNFLLIVILGFITTQVLIRMPQVNADFFTGDANVKSIVMFLAVEIIITVVCQIELYSKHIFRSKTNRNLRNVLWGKILKVKSKYYDRVSPNTLLSRITLDTECLNTFILDILWQFIYSFYYLYLTITEMSEISLKAAFVLLIFVPISIFASFIFGRINLKFQNNEKHTMSNLTDYLSELVASLPIVKSFNQQKFETKRGEQVIEEYYHARTKLIGLDVGRQFVGTLIGILPEMAIIMMGVKMMNAGDMDATAWYIFYMYAGSLFSFASQLGGYWESAKSVQGQLYAISQVLYEEEEGIEFYVNEVIESGDISFDKVSFSYDDVNTVIDQVTFTIPKNKTTAIVGYSGSGKSTILKFITRLYEPTSGRILLAGKDLKDFNLKEWRSKLAYVSQDSPMISGTIRENILYGIKREVSDSEIMEVLKLAYIDEFVQRVGFEYEVGQFGEKLSGGQKQKIAVARAILSKPEYLILDEPTASLDILSSNEIASTIHKLNGQMTIILVAHQAKMVIGADHVIVLNKNHRVIEGSHNELLLTNEYYQQLMKEEVISDEE